METLKKAARMTCTTVMATNITAMPIYDRTGVADGPAPHNSNNDDEGTCVATAMTT